jgi:uncharacterized protein involved in exopolysaccharide biosynthesis
MATLQPRGVDVGDIFRILLKRKWMIILPWIVVTIIVIGGSYFLSPKYQSFTIISIDPNIHLNSDLQRMLGMETDNRERSNAAKQDELRGIFNEITSTDYVKKIGEKLGLLDQPYIREAARKLAASRPELSEEDVVLYLLQSKLQDQITVAFAASDQMKLTVESTSPAEARNIANTVGDIFVSERIRAEMASIRSSQDFSDVQLQKYETMVQQKVQEKTDFEAKFLSKQQDQTIISEANRRDLQAEIDRANDDISDLENEARTVLGQLQTTVTTPVDKLVLKDSEDNKKTKSDLEEQVNAMGDLATKYPWSDPQIINAKLRHDALLKRIALENKRLVNDQFPSLDESARGLLVARFNNRTNLDYAYSKKTNLVAALDQLRNRLRLIPEYQSTLERLNREIAQATQLLEKFKSQQQTSNISQALLGDASVPKYKVIEPAKLPMQPFSPNRKKIIAMGILMGLVVGGAAVLLLELMDKSFKHVEDVEEFLGLRVIGVAPHIDFVKDVMK